MAREDFKPSHQHAWIVRCSPRRKYWAWLWVVGWVYFDKPDCIYWR